MNEAVFILGGQILLALLLDIFFGDIRHYHPLSGFRKLARRVENYFYPQRSTTTPRVLFWLGVLAVVFAIPPFILLLALLKPIPGVDVITGVVVLYFALSKQTLSARARAVSKALLHGNLRDAQQRTRVLLQQKTAPLNEREIIRASVEHVLKNGNSVVFGVLFWFIVGGTPAVMIYRFSDQLYSLWGHNDARYQYFGRFVTILSQILNWLPARLTASTYAIQGNFMRAMECWWQQGRFYSCHNTGIVLAAGAGAIGFCLEGQSIDDDDQMENPDLGKGLPPDLQDIEHSVCLVSRGAWVWLILIVLVESLEFI